MNAISINRRGLISAGALMVGFSLAGRVVGQSAPAKPPAPGSLRTTPLVDSWIRVAADGKVTVLTGKVEFGQGIMTALLQIAAEELDLAPASIDLVTADTARTPDEGVTSGSHSMQDSGEAIRRAAATTRVLLAEAAGRQWNVPPEKVTTSGDGRMKAPDGRVLGYGPLASGLSLKTDARADVPFRQGKRRALGTRMPRVDLPPKFEGGAAFVQDMRLPGMLHARVVRGPSDGTVLKPADLEAVARTPGVVKVVQNGRFLAVVAERQWTAIKAMRTLQGAGWERAGAPFPADPHAAVRQGASEDEVIFDKTAPVPAVVTVKARYTKGWTQHGAIGPSCAVAQFSDGVLTVWTHSQGVYPLRRSLAPVVKLPLDKIRCIHVQGAGCYGHNGADDVAADAALAALAVPGRPVRMQWMREQEHGWEPLGPGMVIEASAGLDASGHVTGWRYDLWSNGHNNRPTTPGGLLAGLEVDPPFPPQKPRPAPMPEGGGDRNGVPIYRIGDGKVISHFIEKAPARVSALRSLGGYMNVFAIESLMDELALAGKQDPVAFRLAHLDDPRARAVIEAAASRFGWAKRPRGDGSRGCGFAFAKYKNLATYCAVAMEIRLDRSTGQIHVERVAAAAEAGEAVSPDSISNQIEGGIVQSISWTLFEASGFDAQRRTAQDWRTYPILRFQDAPGSMDVQILNQPGAPFLGAGEASQGPAAAALANALADASGLRLRDLPLSAERVKAGLTKSA
jgi:CO/xanthine dehydrogenase Mo-binding subunit